jgi:hypothetical protein
MKHRRLLPLSLVFTLALTVPVATSSGEPTAVASKKKCKKALYKCAPRTYHLSADTVVKFPTGSQYSSAEVDLQKRRASVGQVQYTQGGGKVTVRATWTASFSSDLPECESGVTYNVPETTITVPKGGLFSPFDFFLTFYLLGSDKNRYDFIAGNPYGNLEVPGGRATCDGDGSSVAITYFWVGPTKLQFTAPGRPGARRLSGYKAARGDSVLWTMTRK